MGFLGVFVYRIHTATVHAYEYGMHIIVCNCPYRMKERASLSLQRKHFGSVEVHHRQTAAKCAYPEFFFRFVAEQCLYIPPFQQLAFLIRQGV